MTRTRPFAVVLLAVVATTASADVFRVLDDPREAAQARVDIIQQARSEVHALYFLARNDRITLGALALLCDARRRGAGSVRLIVDANFSHIPKAVLAHLREEGVEVRVYHPLTLRHPSWLLRRMHEKVVIVDGERYITGGRNLAEAYFGMAKKNYVDRDVYVEGASAADADRHFENLWSSAHVANLDVHVSAREKRRAHRFAEILNGARESIVIESPYLVPSKILLELLERKRAEGVEVTVLTNSIRSCDGILPQAGYLKYRRRLLRAGIDLREYKGPEMLHAKTAVVDGRVVLIGSYNLDPRSQNLNTEVVCVTDDEEAANAVLASIDEHLRNAWTIGKSEKLPRVSRATSLRAWAARLLLLPLIENQL